MEHDEIFFRAALREVIALEQSLVIVDNPDVDSLAHGTAYYNLRRECDFFLEAAYKYHWLDDTSNLEQAGHDYVASRNGGSGFLDHAADYGTNAASIMRVVCECLPPVSSMQFFPEQILPIE